MDRPTGFPCRRSSPTLPHLRPRPARCSAPRQTDSSRGGEPLDQVRARRGTIALSHQIIDFALHGPAGSPSRRAESETLRSLIDRLFSAGDATPTPSPAGSGSPGDPRQRQPPERRRRPPPSTGIRGVAHGLTDWLGHRCRRTVAEPADHRPRQRSATPPGCVRTVTARRMNVGYESAASSGAPGAVPRAASRRTRTRCLRCSKNDVKSARSS